jgi:hypothetical protein
LRQGEDADVDLPERQAVAVEVREVRASVNPKIALDRSFVLSQEAVKGD